MPVPPLSPPDPLEALTTALSLPADSPAQASAFLHATAAFESSPTSIESVVLPVLASVLGSAPQGGSGQGQDTLMRRWLLEMVFFGVGRSGLGLEQKTSVAEKSLPLLLPLLTSPSSRTQKLIIQTLTCSYPLLFRSICTRRPPLPSATTAPPLGPEQIWTLLSQAKHRIIGLALAISLEEGSLGAPVEVKDGVRVVGWKFIQRCILVGSKGSGDPRLQTPDDPNINMLAPNNQTIRAAELTNETNGFLTQLELQFAGSSNPSIVHAIANMIPPLIKSRPSLANRLVPLISAWTPSALLSSVPIPPTLSQVRAVEKTLKIVMVHLERNPSLAAFAPQLRDALTKQGLRLYAALREEKAERQVWNAGRKARAAAGVGGASGSGSGARVKGAASSGSSRGDAPGSVLSGIKRESVEDVSGASPAKRARLDSPFAATTKVEGIAEISRPDVKSSASTLTRGVNSDQAIKLGLGLDTTSLSLDIAVDGVITTLSGMSNEALIEAVRLARGSTVGKESPIWRALAVLLGDTAHVDPSTTVPNIAGTPAMPSRLQEDEPDDMLLDPEDEDSAIPSGAGMIAAGADIAVKSEEDDGAVVDPLNMLTDEDEGVHEDLVMPAAERAVEAEVEAETAIEVLPLRLAQWKLPPPPQLSEAAALRLLESAMKRIWTGGQDIERQAFDAEDVARLTVDADSTLAEKLVGPKSIWMLLMTRLASRGLEDEDAREGANVVLVRQVLSRYIAEDFASRSSMAAVWLNEEWFSQQVKDGDKEIYNIWLMSLLEAAIERKELGDRALSQFLTKVPEIPTETLMMLKRLCELADTAVAAFITLREIVSFRPPLQAEALRILLGLTSHADRKTRLLAINTVKRWVSGEQPLSVEIRAYAVEMARRLIVPTVDGVKKEPEADPMGGSGGAGLSSEVAIGLTSPIAPDVVKQHLELYLGLTHRQPSMLADLFTIYPQLQESEQSAVDDLVAPLIRALRHARSTVLDILREFPPDAEKLALRIINLLAEGGSPGEDVTDLVKHLMATRDLDARFVAPIAGEMDRAQIQRYLPRFLALLSSRPPEKDLVRQIIRSVVHVPARMSGISNIKQDKDTDKMSAADFLVLLHDEEKLIGVKIALEAIDLSMTLNDLFPQEVLAVVMQRLAEEVNLPILFMRTVLRAVTIHKALVSYVSSTLLPRLISKKIWTQPLLWEGFIRVAKAIAPASFTAMLQLPKEQLKDIMDKQPSLRPAVWQFLLVRSGPAKAQGYAELFGQVAMEAPLQQSHPQAIPAFN